MGKTQAVRERVAKATAALKKRRAKDKHREQKREEKKIRKQQLRWKEKLQEYRQDLRRKRGETLTKEEVRLVLSAYYHYFLDEEVPEEDALHKIHLATGISKNVLDRVVEDWEHRQEIRVFDTARRGNGAAKRSKAPLGTSTYLQQYADRRNEAGQTVTAVEATRWLASEPGDDDWDAHRTPVHVSLQTVCGWLRKVGYEHKEGKKGFAPTEQRGDHG